MTPVLTAALTAPNRRQVKGAKITSVRKNFRT